MTQRLQKLYLFFKINIDLMMNGISKKIINFIFRIKISDFFEKSDSFFQNKKLFQLCVIRFFKKKLTITADTFELQNTHNNKIQNS
jgi:hypothetical protein